MPAGLGASIAALVWVVPGLAMHPVVSRSFFGAAGVLVLGGATLLVLRHGHEFAIEPLLKKPHWVQMCAQGSLMVYWGWHVRSVYGNLPMVLAQLLFAYGLDALISFARDGRWRVGFGPIPIVISINFFLWFKPEFYYWQFAIVALGYAAKTFLHWERDGKRRHIFNPSSFPLSIFSLVLIVTGSTSATYGLEIAQSLFNPPLIYLVIFLVALPGQILFGVATMTIAAVVTTYAWSLGYFAVTGTYFFRDAYIPIAVFLGMHLLFTDPATSPKSEQGRVIFGMLYAVFTIGAAAILEATGAPTFYDKLLPIPILNLMVRRIDRVAALSFFQWLDPGKAFAFTGLRARHATAALWTLVFGAMALAKGVGDEHPGQYLPFWVEACEAESQRACEYVLFVQQVYCERGSSWACNERGVTLATRFGDFDGARAHFERSCSLGFGPACTNVVMDPRVSTFVTGLPPDEELPIVVRGSKGAVRERDSVKLHELACQRGWDDFCGAGSGQEP